MRISIFCLLCVSSVAVAQQPPVSLNPQGQGRPVLGQPVVAPQPPNPNQVRLNQLLQQWEQKMRTVNALEVEVERTETDAVTKTTELFRGKAKFLRPDRAHLYLQKVSKPDIVEQYMFTGNFLYQYLAQSKRLNIFEMEPPRPGKAMNDNFFGFLVGMSAIEAQQRYDLTLAKEDEHYVYIFIVPKSNSDLQDFTKARLVLLKANFLPRQLEFESPAGAITKWDIPRIDTAARLSPADFTPPQVPRDWQTQRVPRQGVAPPPATPAPPPPTKVRPAGKP